MGDRVEGERRKLELISGVFNLYSSSFGGGRLWPLVRRRDRAAERGDAIALAPLPVEISIFPSYVVNQSETYS